MVHMMLEKLLEARGVSGNEHEIKALILKEIRKHVKDVKVDKFGNIVAHKKGKGPKVMLAAHMDEVGLMVKSISSNGNIYCAELGGLEAMPTIGQRVHIKTRKATLYGVVTTPEISDDELHEDVPKISDIVVDTGLSKKELVKKGVDIGTFLEFDRRTKTLGNKDTICGKAVDDRVGCYILLELAKMLKKTKTDIYFVFTVQEEVGLYGSKTSVYSLDPDWAIAVDVTNANDSKAQPHQVTKRLGNGPCITIKDADMISNICIDEWLKQIAKKKRIPIQLEVNEVGTTDALSISISKGGIPTTVVGVAARNLHTTIGIVNRKDIENAIKLIAALLADPPMACVT